MDQVVQGEVSEENRHHVKRHEAEGVDGEDKANSHVLSDDRSRGAGTHSPYDPSHNGDVGLCSDKLGAHTDHTHPHEDAGSMHETHEKLPSHGMHTNDGHVDIIHDSPKSASTHGKHASHESDASVTHEQSANTQVHGEHIHGNEGVQVVQESREKFATHEKHLPDNGHAGSSHGDSTHGIHIHVQDVQVLAGTDERSMMHGKQHVNADEHSSTEAKHRLDAGEADTSNILKEKSPRYGKLMYDRDAAGVIHELRHKQGKHKDDARVTVLSQEHGEKCQSVDDDCESKGAFSDDNSSRDKVHFSRGSTPDVDTPTQHARNPLSNPKILKAGGKGIGSTERGPGSADGNPETPSTSWAFSARASIAPSKFDHMATLRMTYGAYKETIQGKEGVPLSLMQCSQAK